MRSSEDIEDCDVIYVGGAISATCTYSPNSVAIGLQMIVQKSNVLTVKELRVSQTIFGSLTVNVEDTGLYHVVIFPIHLFTGISNTNYYSTKYLVTDGMLYTHG